MGFEEAEAGQQSSAEATTLREALQQELPATTFLQDASYLEATYAEGEDDGGSTDLGAAAEANNHPGSTYKTCSGCGTTSTPQWRSGPAGAEWGVFARRCTASSGGVPEGSTWRL